MAETNKAEPEDIYQITVEGQLDERWSDWLGNFKVTKIQLEDGSVVTSLSGPVVDQAALRGVLERMWNLNIKVVSVVQIAV